MRLILARHGQTDDNVRGMVQGQTDTPLNDQGRHQSAQLSEALKRYHITKAYTSPLSRASETAKIVLAYHPDAPLYFQDDLRERGWGSLEGQVWIPGTIIPDDAESFDDFTRRSTDWFAKLLDAHIPHLPSPEEAPPLLRGPFPESHHSTEDVILIITHSEWLERFAAITCSSPYFFGQTEKCDMKARIVNASVAEVDCVYDHQEGVWKGMIEGWGAVGHLSRMGESD
ncbi:hypothetical protein I350_05807 [Cryptococcus amylolentus CBS 6273]|uniref:Phosphoglycerate mutase n=1 Tax=Cryptococcus amylolentus CBS 6273 TaxID=1296118 RepID=A0A1E3JQ36_9TREE|nr:hypothetical protein I350_05807 [Cryptococcus amylolentus CBS 6273]